MSKDMRKDIEKFKDIAEIDLTAELIENNVLPFEYRGVSYRVTKPNFGQKKLTYKYRAQKETELLEEKDEKGNYKNKTMVQLIELHAKRGINIKEINKEIVKLQETIAEKNIEMGKELTEKKPSDRQLHGIKKEIEELTEDLENLVYKKTGLLESAIETQLQNEFYCYLAYLVTEKLVKEDDEEKWVKVWDNYEEVQNSDEKLVTKAAFFTSLTMEELSEI